MEIQEFTAEALRTPRGISILLSHERGEDEGGVWTDRSG
jgi:hypothetical protein